MLRRDGSARGQVKNKGKRYMPTRSEGFEEHALPLSQYERSSMWARRRKTSGSSRAASSAAATPSCQAHIKPGPLRHTVTPHTYSKNGSLSYATAALSMPDHGPIPTYALP